MDKLNKKNTQEKIAAINAATNEPHFKATDLLEEIKPLLEDYFSGDFEFDGTQIRAAFLNGQKFRIIAEEI